MSALIIPPVERVDLPIESSWRTALERLQQSVSPSRLTLFQSCRLRFFFRYVCRLRKPRAAALHLGEAVHATLAHWNRARWYQQPSNRKEVYAAYEQAWAKAKADERVAWENLAHEAEQKRTGWRLVETFLRETTLQGAAKPAAVEVSVEADLGAHGLPPLVGVLDLVQDGRVIDFKTTATTPHPERAVLVHATQATAYALLYRHNTGRREQAVELHHLVKLKAPRLVVVTLPGVGQREVSRLLHVIKSYVPGCLGPLNSKAHA